MSGNGLDKMRQQRAERARNKPKPRHPRTDTGPDQGEVEDPPAGQQPPASPETADADTTGTPGSAEQPQVLVVEQPAVPVEESPPAPDTREVPAPPRPEIPAPKPEVPNPTAGDGGRRRTTAAGRSRAGRQPAPATGAVVSLRGEEERKQVEVDALSWAASVRKIAEREQHVMDSIREALAAGTPVELITAALVQAEARAGASFSPQVRALLGQRRQAR
ncbi:hypothetical protein [Saccharothrix obliqua]|uniref:hypothetical protein n=1 Tax=Saccharothrix obliqua TaxID=2861747 RepID=UPI001C5DC2FF|nr:hypothetical protein [Saccharothrix obliqua]MBW4722412.1 hypothetical protein [Saccharothrix obliqua]